MSSPRRALALVCGLLALAALVVGAWAAGQFRAATHARPWFVAPSGLAVGDDGTLFVGVDGREVQAYAADGAPRRAWRVEAPGAFRLRADGGRVELAFADGRVAAYTASGERVALRDDPDAWRRFGAAGEREASHGDARFSLTEAGLVRTAPGPARVLVPAPPPPLAWFGARPLLPVSGLLLAAPLGLVACLALSRRVGPAAPRRLG